MLTTAEWYPQPGEGLSRCQEHVVWGHHGRHGLPAEQSQIRDISGSQCHLPCWVPGYQSSLLSVSPGPMFSPKQSHFCNIPFREGSRSNRKSVVVVTTQTGLRYWRLNGRTYEKDPVLSWACNGLHIWWQIVLCSHLSPWALKGSPPLFSNQIRR